MSGICEVVEGLSRPRLTRTDVGALWLERYEWALECGQPEEQAQRAADAACARALAAEEAEQEVRHAG